jgi:hypothetical protein
MTWRELREQLDRFTPQQQDHQVEVLITSSSSLYRGEVLYCLAVWTADEWSPVTKGHRYLSA